MSDGSLPVPVSAASSRSTLAWAFVGKYGTLVGLLLMVVGFSLFEPKAFPTGSNLTNVLAQVSLTAIIAGGMTFPLVAGEFDLSVGFQASMAGMLAVGLQVNQGIPMVATIIIVLSLGLAIGFVNGIVVTKLGVNALIATLGVGTIVTGITYAYSEGIPIAVPRGSPFTALSLGNVVGIPNPIIFATVVLALLWVLLNQTDTGLNMRATGGNPVAARLSGVRTDRFKIISFMVAGLCAAMTGTLLASRIGSGQITAGDNYLLDSFAAVYLGSAALRDGEFHIIGTAIGVLVVGIGYNGLAILGAPVFVQYVFKGALLVVAVALSTVARRYARR
jgi:ribose transport system permease protein